MSDFRNVEIGDKVWSVIHGEGEVVSNRFYIYHPSGFEVGIKNGIRATFNRSKTFSYYYDGRLRESDLYPELYLGRVEVIETPQPNPKYKVWSCKLAISSHNDLPDGFDSVPRLAAQEAVEKYFKVIANFSGWGASLNKVEEILCDKFLEEMRSKRIVKKKKIMFFNVYPHHISPLYGSYDEAFAFRGHNYIKTESHTFEWEEEE